MKNKFIIWIPILTGLLGCYDKPKINIRPAYPENFEEIGKLSNFSTLICDDIKEVIAKKITFRSEVYRKFNSEEKIKIEKCITLAGVVIDTSNGPGHVYLYDSTIYVDIRIVSDSSNKYLSYFYPDGWGDLCLTGRAIRKFNIEINDSTYLITNEIKN